MKCFISKTTYSGDNEYEKVLNNITQVPTYKNARFQEIMKARANWKSNPTIFIDNTPYKIKLLELSDYKAEFLQMLLKINKKNNGSSWYEIINIRKVIIHFK
jgi:hypothetical protein